MARPARIEGETAYITLTKGYETVIDASDAINVSAYDWYAYRSHKNVYAARTFWLPNGKRHALHLHSFIIAPPPGLIIDHIDGNGLNNRRSNLRVATYSENARNCRFRPDNTSGFRGVSWNKGTKKWRAQIKVNGDSVWLGLFEKPEDAHAAYVEAAKLLHGEFARF